MAHKTLIGGTAYKIKGGRDLIGGTGYAKKSGKVLINGTAYGIPLSLFDPVFSNNGWNEIALACASHSVPDTWGVGDNKYMDIGGTAYRVDIIGKNHDDYADDTGKAPLTFMLHDLYATMFEMNSSNTNKGGWASCAMRMTHLPSIMALMPQNVRNGIREVRKLTSVGNNSSNITTTADKLFLISEIEATGGAGNYSPSGEGNQYTYYTTKENRKKKRQVDQTNNLWWLRSPTLGTDWRFCSIDTYANAWPEDAGSARGVCFAFCF